MEKEKDQILEQIGEEDPMQKVVSKLLNMAKINIVAKLTAGHGDLQKEESDSPRQTKHCL